MGYYIEGPSRGKVEYIREKYGAVVVDEVTFDPTHGIVVVIDNGMFEAACFCYDSNELHRCLDPLDNRPKTVLMGDYKVLGEAAGYYVGEKDA